MDCGYLGGFFDGEGTVYETSGRIRISIPQTNYEVLDIIRKFVGVGNIYVTKKKKEIHKDAWVYTITNNDGVLKFLTLIKDDIIVKKDIVAYFIVKLKEREVKNNTLSLERDIERKKVTELKLSGLSYRKIEKIMGFSRQKVCRLLKEVY